MCRFTYCGIGRAIQKVALFDASSIAVIRAKRNLLPPQAALRNRLNAKVDGAKFLRDIFAVSEALRSTRSSYMRGDVA